MNGCTDWPSARANSFGSGGRCEVCSKSNDHLIVQAPRQTGLLSRRVRLQHACMDTFNDNMIVQAPLTLGPSLIQHVWQSDRAKCYSAMRSVLPLLGTSQWCDRWRHPERTTTDVKQARCRDVGIVAIVAPCHVIATQSSIWSANRHRLHR